MRQLGEYVVSLTATAMIIGIILPLVQEGSIRNLLRFVCGLVLMTVALQPFTKLSLSEISLFPEACIQEGEAVAALGQDMAAEETTRRIQRQLEAYISDKASQLGVSVTVTVELDAQQCPSEVSLTGACAEEERQKLTAIITNDLGVPEEAQKWTGEK